MFFFPPAVVADLKVDLVVVVDVVVKGVLSRIDNLLFVSRRSDYTVKLQSACSKIHGVNKYTRKNNTSLGYGREDGYSFVCRQSEYHADNFSTDCSNRHLVKIETMRLISDIRRKKKNSRCTIPYRSPVNDSDKYTIRLSIPRHNRNSTPFTTTRHHH